MKYKIIYFKEFINIFGREGLIVEEIEAENPETAAFLFSKKHFPYFEKVTPSKFRKLDAHVKYWNLTIEGKDYGEHTLACHRQYIKKINLETKRLRVLYDSDVPCEATQTGEDLAHGFVGNTELQPVAAVSNL